HYSYDANGNLRTKTFNDSTVTTYAYDAANEMCWSYAGTSSNGCASPPTGATTYTYDGDGNLKTSSAGLSIPYNTANQMPSITPPGGGSISMSYADATQDQRVSAGADSFTYDLLGLSSKATGGQTTYYTRDPGGKL